MKQHSYLVECETIRDSTQHVFMIVDLFRAESPIEARNMFLQHFKYLDALLTFRHIDVKCLSMDTITYFDLEGNIVTNLFIENLYRFFKAVGIYAMQHIILERQRISVLDQIHAETFSYSHIQDFSIRKNCPCPLCKYGRGETEYSSVAQYAEGHSKSDFDFQLWKAVNRFREENDIINEEGE